LPKNKSKEIILQTEKHDREFYSGFLGKIGVEQKTDLFVNLRCMKILPEHFQLFAGGGLTIDSECDKEWEETNQKIQTLLSVIDNYNYSK
ncbi:MAG: chorismate-binding protein, partial [Bacteroidota bacterium]|nr:chorismate-binding protein [Bacteroidota bacterium]